MVGVQLMAGPLHGCVAVSSWMGSSRTAAWCMPVPLLQVAHAAMEFEMLLKNRILVSDLSLSGQLWFSASESQLHQQSISLLQRKGRGCLYLWRKLPLSGKDKEDVVRCS